MTIYILIVILVLAIGILWVFRNGNVRISRVEKEKIYKAWTQVRELQNGDDHARSRAVMEADKVLDWGLQLLGIPGNTMGDRLKNCKGRIRNLDGVWKAHILRNKLAHEIDARPTASEIHAAVKQFEIAIRHLGLM